MAFSSKIFFFVNTLKIKTMVIT